MKVVIVGAGACGLMAARELYRAGHVVIILEARDRIGGRIFPQSIDEFGYEAMGGAEFVHGEAPVTNALVLEAGLRYEQPTEWWSVTDGEPSRSQTPSPHKPELERVLATIEHDMTVQSFLDTHFPGEEYADIREYARRWTESYDAGDVTRASVIAMRDSMLFDAQWGQRSITEGYGTLLRHLAAGLSGVEIRLKEKVTSIDLSGESVIVHAGRSYECDEVLVTVALPAISDIVYTPAIPETVAAASMIGFGSVIKILLSFKTKWWGSIRSSIFERLFFMFSKEIVPTWWTQYPKEVTTLTGWVAGPKAHALRKKTDDEILRLAIESLSNIFVVPVQTLHAELVHARVFDWDRDQYTRGAYSYPTPETERALEILGTPVLGKLYFAGEAFGDYAQATVEGALASGKETAARMMDRS